MDQGEWLRKAAHMAAFAPALLLPLLSPFHAFLMAGGLFLLNVLVLPRLAPRLYRNESPGHGALEVVLYPVALMAIMVAYGFPENPRDEVRAADLFGGETTPWYPAPMAAWFCLAFVDAWIGIGCRLLRFGPALPWNPRKPVAGFLAGTAAACLIAWAGVKILAFAELFPPLAAFAWFGADLSSAWVLTGLLVVCALVETAWFGITDNLTVPFTFCVLLPLFPSPLLPGGGVPQVTLLLVAAPAAFGILANAFGMLTLAGALLGTLMAFFLVAAEPWLFAFMGGFFVLANGATRFGREAKEARHVAEERGGKRSAAQVFGAMGAAAWLTPLVHLTEHSYRTGTGDDASVHAALLVCVAPFLAKTMDTVSSEMGKAIGGFTVSIRTFRPVKPGAEGGVSLAGTSWGLAAATVLALPVLFLGWGGPKEVGILVGATLAANLFESYWGDWAEPRGLEDGPHTNFLMTLMAALLAWVFLF